MANASRRAFLKDAARAATATVAASALTSLAPAARAQGVADAAGAAAVEGAAVNGVAASASPTGRSTVPKIARVEMIPVEAPGRTLVCVIVETEDGQIGVGEAGLQRRVEALRGALEHIRPVIVGMDPRRIEYIWQTVFRGGFYPADRVVGSVLAAIDMALWDLKAKSYGVPVYELMGGLSRDRVFCYAGAPGAQVGAQPEERDKTAPADLPRKNELYDIPATVAACREFLASGWRFMRFNPPLLGDLSEPRPSILNLLELIDALRSELGDEFEFLVDLHTRFDQADAIWFCREVEKYRPYFVEDPLRAEYIDGYEHVRRHTNVPLAIGEQYMNKWDFRKIIEADLVDFARIDLAIACGLTEGRKIAGWCEVHHVKLAPHNPLGPINLAAGLHLNLASANGAIQETPWLPNTQLPDVFKVGFEFKDGALYPPTAPGLGVEFNIEAAKQYPYIMSEPPHFKALDGGYANY